jgi:hypothetical protein
VRRDECLVRRVESFNSENLSRFGQDSVLTSFEIRVVIQKRAVRMQGQAPREISTAVFFRQSPIPRMNVLQDEKVWFCVAKELPLLFPLVSKVDKRTFFFLLKL